MRKQLSLSTAMLAGFLVFAGSANADFQYRSTSRMTGGALLKMMRFVPGTGALREPQVSTVALSGNRLVRKSKRQAEIIDLDRQTITTVDFEKSTWYEMTFDQMKQMLDQMSTALQQSAQQPDAGKARLDVNADIKDTGQTKTVNGLEAHGFLLTMSMAGTDPQSGQSGAMKVDSSMWMAKDVPGVGQLRDFYKRMAGKLDWAPTGMGAMMNRPDLNRAMAKMMAEGQKMEGTRVQQVVRISMAASGDGSGAASDTTSARQAQPAPSRPSLSDALGGALGGKLGGFGGFGRKKKQNAAPDSASAAPASADQPQSVEASLIEMTIDDTDFSTADVDASLFEIPSGFRKLDPPATQAYGGKK